MLAAPCADGDIGIARCPRVRLDDDGQPITVEVVTDPVVVAVEVDGDGTHGRQDFNTLTATFLAETELLG